MTSVLDTRRWPPAPNRSEQDLLLATARSGRWTDGPWTETVEQQMCDLTGAPFAVAFNSCTSALHAALLAHGVQYNAPVTCPALSFIGTVTGAVHIGAALAWTDADPVTLTQGMLIIPETDPHPSRGAALAVDLHGVPHTGSRTSYAGTPVITDACQSLGTTIGGRHIGWAGTHAWSFSSAKLIAAPDGGAITTDTPLIAERLRELRNYGMAAGTGDRGNALVVNPGGHNWRPSELTMTMVACRLTQLDRYTERTRAAAQQLHEALDRAGLWYQRTPPGTDPAWHKIRIGPPDWDPLHARRLERALNDRNVPTHRWGSTPLHKHPALIHSTPPYLHTSERAAAGTFCIGTETSPPHTWSLDELDNVCNILEHTTGD